MGRSGTLVKNFATLKSTLHHLGHPECRILEDHTRSELITSLVEWYATKCGPLNTPEVLRKGWKGFEDMNDLELIDDWLKTSCNDFASEIKSSITLKLKLLNDIYKVTTT